MYVNQFLTWNRNIHQLIASCCHFSHPRSNHDQQIGILDKQMQFGIGSYAKVTDITAVVIVHPVLTPECNRHRQILLFCKMSDETAGFRRPTTSSENHQRTFSILQHLPDLTHLFHARSRLNRNRARCVFHLRYIPQHIFRQRKHYRPRSA